ncbi:CD151 antigen-like isoform X2 [Mya arenaria]|uniref:CD151 antigen-like isoform X2 n=1 Tax=Mya arenaria TaxID=6604 RepID=UPI0022E66EA7|nr:CD151 antigen-like isoform X2 [Mya arenaria]
MSWEYDNFGGQSLFSGLGILGLGIWLMLTGEGLRAALEPGQLTIPTYLLLVPGAASVVVGVIGCLAVFGASRGLLAFYSVCVFCLCAVSTAAAVKTLLLHDNISSSVLYWLETSMKYKYCSNEDSKIALDKIQKEFECCGVHDHTEWYSVDRDRRTCHTTQSDRWALPVSCCIDQTKCNRNNSIQTPDNIYMRGCLAPVSDSLSLILNVIGWTSTIFAAFLIPGGTMACCFRVSLKRL